MALAILLSSFPAAMDCAAQASFQPEREPLRGPHAGAPDSNIRRSELVLAEKVVRQALRYLPGRLRPEDCQVVDDLESLFQGRDPALARQARGYEAFVLDNHYPIFLNLHGPLLQTAVRSYKQAPMDNSVFIYLLAAVLAHERVHAGEPNPARQACPDCTSSVGSPNESKAYEAEVMLLRQFRSLHYIEGDHVDRYIDHVEHLARASRKKDKHTSRPEGLASLEPKSPTKRVIPEE